jgi:hypothetical protein
MKSLPWLWIGAVYPLETVDATNTIIDKILPGMRITPEYLSEVSGFYPNSWKYLDAETLEEKEFPSDGFVIEDDTCPVSFTNDSS